MANWNAEESGAKEGGLIALRTIIPNSVAELTAEGKMRDTVLEEGVQRIEVPLRSVQLIALVTLI